MGCPLEQANTEFLATAGSYSKCWHQEKQGRVWYLDLCFHLQTVNAQHSQLLCWWLIELRSKRDIISRGLAALWKCWNLPSNGVHHNHQSDRGGQEFFSYWKVHFKSLSTKNWTDLGVKKQQAYYAFSYSFQTLLHPAKPLHGFDRFPLLLLPSHFHAGSSPSPQLDLPSILKPKALPDETLLFTFWLCSVFKYSPRWFSQTLEHVGLLFKWKSLVSHWRVISFLNSNHSCSHGKR